MNKNGFEIEFTHPSTKILSSKSTRLLGKKIVLGVTGSVAAFLAPQIARELIREGATVISVLSPDALGLIGKNLMWWATGIEPITKITGKLEHISLAGVMNRPADLMLIIPCTTNSVAKIATGIADTPVTLIASSLFGKGIPLQLLVVGHSDLYNSPPIQSAISMLKERGVFFIEPDIIEGKAKIPALEETLFYIFKKLTPQYLLGRKVIITGGSTREYIDGIRFITTGASGLTGVSLAKEAMLYGADVTLILGDTRIPIPKFLNTITTTSYKDMTEKTINEITDIKNPLVILSAAMADFYSKEIFSGKVKSSRELTVKLIPAPKLSDKIKLVNDSCDLIIFKAEWDVGMEALVASARKKIQETKARLAIANDISNKEEGFGTISNTVFLISKIGKVKKIHGRKQDIALEIIQYICEKII